MFFFNLAGSHTGAFSYPGRIDMSAVWSQLHQQEYVQPTHDRGAQELQTLVENWRWNIPDSWMRKDLRFFSDQTLYLLFLSNCDGIVFDKKNKCVCSVFSPLFKSLYVFNFLFHSLTNYFSCFADMNVVEVEGGFHCQLCGKIIRNNISCINSFTNILNILIPELEGGRGVSGNFLGLMYMGLWV